MRQNDPDSLSDITTQNKAIDLYNRYQSIESDPDANLLVLKVDSTGSPGENVEKIIASLADLRKN